MRKILSIIAVLLGVSFSSSIFANTLNIYEKPDENSTVKATMQRGEKIVPIFYTEKKDWVEVGNPQNGDIGWV